MKIVIVIALIGIILTMVGFLYLFIPMIISEWKSYRTDMKFRKALKRLQNGR
jgi:hypothetical protein